MWCNHIYYGTAAFVPINSINVDTKLESTTKFFFSFFFFKHQSQFSFPQLELETADGPRALLKWRLIIFEIPNLDLDPTIAASVLPHPSSLPFLFPSFPGHQLSCLLCTTNKSVTISAVTAGREFQSPHLGPRGGGRAADAWRPLAPRLPVLALLKIKHSLEDRSDWVRAVGGKDGRKWPPSQGKSN